MSSGHLSADERPADSDLEDRNYKVAGREAGGTVVTCWLRADG